MVTLKRSSNVEVGTPPELLEGMQKWFGRFNLDTCCNPPLTTPVAPVWYTPTSDGLKSRWFGRSWCNPPFGSEETWVTKACFETQGTGSTTKVAMIFPVKSSMKWWRLVIKFASNILFVEGRMKFVGMKWQAPFPVVLVLFNCHDLAGVPKLGIINRSGEIVV